MQVPCLLYINVNSLAGLSLRFVCQSLNFNLFVSRKKKVAAYASVLIEEPCLLPKASHNSKLTVSSRTISRHVKRRLNR